jgi:small-conductance mechanosensitive channel
MEIKLFDTNTAIALSQILPILLLALMVELRRTELHHRGRSPKRTRAILAVFFGAFAIVETTLVMSIDGHLLPTRLSDLVVALIIFVLLWLLFLLSLVNSPRDEQRSHRK